MKHLIFMLLITLTVAVYAQREQRPGKPATQPEPPQTTQPREARPTPEPQREQRPPTTTASPKKATAPKTQAQTAVKGAEQQITGVIVALEDVLMGKGRKLTPEEAQANINNKKPIGLMSGDNVYIVINKDFTLASDKLFTKAKDEQVTIKGELFDKGGMKFIRFVEFVNQPK